MATAVAAAVLVAWAAVLPWLIFWIAPRIDSYPRPPAHTAVVRRALRDLRPPAIVHDVVTHTDDTEGLI